MPQQVGTINIEAHEHSDFLYDFPTTRAENGSLIDSLWSGRMQIRDSFNVLQADAAVMISANGKPSIFVRRQDLVTPGQYVYDLILRDPAGLHSKRYQGTFRVRATITEWADPPAPWIPPTPSIPDLVQQHNSSALAHDDIRSAIKNKFSAPPISPPYNPANIYDLMKIPDNPASTKVFINGVKQVYGTDYTIADTLLTWVSPGLNLSANDIIEVYL